MKVIPSNTDDNTGDNAEGLQTVQNRRKRTKFVTENRQQGSKIPAKFWTKFTSFKVFHEKVFSASIVWSQKLQLIQLQIYSHRISQSTLDIIEDVRKSGFGIYIGSVFLGCILYADDILLLSGSSTGLQQMVDVCVQYGRQWGILLLNATKSQYITFGGNRSILSRIMLDNAEMKRVCKLKYLGCHFYERSCRIEL